MQSQFKELMSCMSINPTLTLEEGLEGAEGYQANLMFDFRKSSSIGGAMMLRPLHRSRSGHNGQSIYY